MNATSRIDPAALLERVSEHATLVAPIVASIVRSRNWVGRLDWPDLMQSGFLGLLEACHTYDPGRSSFRTYASRKIEWSVYAALRQNNPLRVVSEHGYAYGDFEQREPIDPAPGPDRAYELRELLDSLSRRQRQLLQLRLSGYTQVQAAREMGISQAAVQGLEQRALKRLRQRERPLDKAA